MKGEIFLITSGAKSTLAAEFEHKNLISIKEGAK